MKEIIRAVTGHNPENVVSVFQVIPLVNSVNLFPFQATVATNSSILFSTQPITPDESSTAILQESLVDLMGYYLVFAPLDMTSINMAITGSNLPIVPVLPSGFVITGDGRGANPKQLNNQFSDEDVGSILTVALQMPLSDSAFTKQNHMDVAADTSARLSSTVEKIKAALTPTSYSETA